MFSMAPSRFCRRTRLAKAAAQALVPVQDTGPDTRFQLAPGLGAPAQARGHLLAAISAGPAGGVDADVAVLLASELVTNAVCHAGAGLGEVVMRVCWPSGGLRVEVHDASREPPRLREEAEAESGRGLVLVDALAADWGYYLTPRGKAVYFTLTASGAE